MVGNHLSSTYKKHCYYIWLIDGWKSSGSRNNRLVQCRSPHNNRTQHIAGIIGGKWLLSIPAVLFVFVCDLLWFFVVGVGGLLMGHPSDTTSTTNCGQNANNRCNPRSEWVQTNPDKRMKLMRTTITKTKTIIITVECTCIGIRLTGHFKVNVWP